QIEHEAVSALAVINGRASCVNFQDASLHEGNNAADIVYGNDLVPFFRDEMQVLNGNSGTCMLLEKALPAGPLRTTQQGDRSPDNMRAHPLPGLDVIFGKIALGNARIIPVNAVGMSEMNAGNGVMFGRCAAFYGRCTAGGGNGRFTHTLFGRLVLAHALERCLTYPVAVRPAAE